MLKLCCVLASSVDAERSFSCGRLQVGHLQHGVSSQTFKAKMALGSWSRTPLLPSNHAEDIITARMKGQGKAKAVGQPANDAREVMVID